MSSEYVASAVSAAKHDSTKTSTVFDLMRTKGLTLAVRRCARSQAMRAPASALCVPSASNCQYT